MASSHISRRDMLVSGAVLAGALGGCVAKPAATSAGGYYTRSGKHAIAGSTFSPPTRRWLESGSHLSVDGHRVFVHARGSGPVIVFIHGFPTSAFDWRNTIDQLASDYRCIAVDLLGYGLSDKPRRWSYSLFQQADIVEGVLTAMQVEAAHVVSHDVGTSLHTELVAREGEGTLSFRLRASTFLNGSMVKSMAALTDFQKMLEVPSRIPEAQRFLANSLPTYVENLKQNMRRPDRVSEDDAIVMREVMGYQDGHLNIPAVYAYVRERYLHSETWVQALEMSTVPTQIVWAADDPIAVVAMGRSLAQRVSHARYAEIPGIGHFTPIEAPNVVAAEVRRFEQTL